MCRCVSIMPGITMPPEASISTVPSGTSRPGPTAAMRSPTTRTSASRSTDRAVVHGQHGAAAEHDRATRLGRLVAAGLGHGVLLVLDGPVPEHPTAPDERPYSGRGSTIVTMNRCRRARQDPLCGLPSEDQEHREGADVPRRDDDPDFVEAVARGLDVLKALRARPAADDPGRGRRARPAWPGRRPAGSCAR